MVAYGGRDDGLFSAGVMQSGNPASWRALNGTEFYQPLYENVTSRVHPSASYAAEHNMSPDEHCSDAIDTLACLRTGRVEELVAVFNGSRDISQKWFPVVDGDLLKELPTRQLNRGAFVKIPIISGTTTNEGHWFVPPISTAEEFHTYLLRELYSILHSKVLLTRGFCSLDPQILTGRPYQLGLPRKLADKLFEAYWPGICPDNKEGNCTTLSHSRVTDMTPGCTFNSFISLLKACLLILTVI